MNDTAHHFREYPHPGGCDDCRRERHCNSCGADISAATRCTNGRCQGCHRSTCTSGGSDSPGHGYGDAHQREVARANTEFNRSRKVED